MSTLTELCLAFLRVGAFSFGGGYAALAFIERELVGADKWLTLEDYVNTVAIAQITPGSTAINASACVGFNLFGALGALLCAISVMAIPFVLVLVVSAFYAKVSNNIYVKKAFAGIRPAVVGIVAAACFSVAKGSITSLYSFLFLGLGILLAGKFKLPPILTLIICGASGIVFYSFLLPVLGI